MASTLKPWDTVLVHAYKHNGDIYRCWEKVIVLDIFDDKLILVNEKVIVTEMNGRKWKTNEPAIWVFGKNQWNNVICMFKENEIHYYCNIASPFIYEEGAIKYIDYDLDVKVFNKNNYKILDLKEFNRNRINWNYPHKLVSIIWAEVENIKNNIKNKKGVFNENTVKSYWQQYLDLKSKH